ncbi:hypothetical protein V496_06986 [Pseudogymnoascus sp. VKM F-4515 (FW-2607)]|nr:hypothetical protein V496_06986 [Pseudogymnoascus sp. VKM F-4515 (FW-2607)]
MASRLDYIHGGHVAAAVQLAAQTHFTTTLAAQNQPDILTLHLDFLLSCVLQPMQITIVDLKVGKGTSTIQLQVKQKNKLKAIAIATSTNFDQSVGQTVKSDWAFHPPPNPVPDFAKVLAHAPEDNWIPLILAGEIGPFTGHQLTLQPRGGFPTAGICDAWSTIRGERMDATYLTMMTDSIPSTSDTLLRNNGTYDARRLYAGAKAWAERNPGVPAPLTNSFEDAARATTFDITLSIDILFKRKVPKEGQEWIFMRAESRMMLEGRVDLDVTVCDHNMDVLCLARHTIMSLHAERKFTDRRKEKPKSSL